MHPLGKPCDVTMTSQKTKENPGNKVYVNIYVCVIQLLKVSSDWLGIAFLGQAWRSQDSLIKSCMCVHCHHAGPSTPTLDPDMTWHDMMIMWQVLHCHVIRSGRATQNIVTWWMAGGARPLRWRSVLVLDWSEMQCPWSTDRAQCYRQAVVLVWDINIILCLLLGKNPLWRSVVRPRLCGVLS